jgi:hypothetical protein
MGRGGNRLVVGECVAAPRLRGVGAGFPGVSPPAYSSPNPSPSYLEGLVPSHRKVGRGKICPNSLVAKGVPVVWCLGRNTHRPATNSTAKRATLLNRFSRGTMRFGSLTNAQTMTAIRIRLSISTSPNQSQRVCVRSDFFSCWSTS